MLRASGDDANATATQPRKAADQVLNPLNNFLFLPLIEVDRCVCMYATRDAGVPRSLSGHARRVSVLRI